MISGRSWQRFRQAEGLRKAQKSPHVISEPLPYRHSRPEIRRFQSPSPQPTRPKTLYRAIPGHSVGRVLPSAFMPHGRPSRRTTHKISTTLDRLQPRLRRQVPWICGSPIHNGLDTVVSIRPEGLWVPNTERRIHHWWESGTSLRIAGIERLVRPSAPPGQHEKLSAPEPNV